MTLQEFSEVFVVLAAQLQHAADAPEIRLYYRVFRDLDREFVAAAADQLARGDAMNRKGDAWFPKAPEWRVLAPVCGTCEDTGWQRTVDPGGVERVSRCACWTQREAERLGHAPPPLALPAALTPPDPSAFRRIRAMVRPIAKAHAMPRSWWDEADANDPVIAAELRKRKRPTSS